MNVKISDYTVSLTLGKRTGRDGSACASGISASMIDKADRDSMHSCLVYYGIRRE